MTDVRFERRGVSSSINFTSGLRISVDLHWFLLHGSVITWPNVSREGTEKHRRKNVYACANGGREKFIDATNGTVVHPYRPGYQTNLGIHEVFPRMQVDERHLKQNQSSSRCANRTPPWSMQYHPRTVRIQINPSLPSEMRSSNFLDFRLVFARQTSSRLQRDPDRAGNRRDVVNAN